MRSWCGQQLSNDGKATVLPAGAVRPACDSLSAPGGAKRGRVVDTRRQATPKSQPLQMLAYGTVVMLPLLALALAVVRCAPDREHGTLLHGYRARLSMLLMLCVYLWVNCAKRGQELTGEPIEIAFMDQSYTGEQAREDAATQGI